MMVTTHRKLESRGSAEKCFDGHGSRRNLARQGNFELLLTGVTRTFQKKKLLMAVSQEIEILMQKQIIKIV